MEALLQQISDWLKGMLVDGIKNNLSGMFDAVNQQVADGSMSRPKRRRRQ